MTNIKYFEVERITNGASGEKRTTKTFKDEEKAMDIALEAGADDVVTNEDGSIDVYTSPEAFPAVVDAFNDNNIKPDNAQVTMTPSTEADLDADTAVKFMRMIDALEDLDDVQEVYHNASIPDDVNLD